MGSPRKRKVDHPSRNGSEVVQSGVRSQMKLDRFWAVSRGMIHFSHSGGPLSPLSVCIPDLTRCTKIIEIAWTTEGTAWQRSISKSTHAPPVQDIPRHHLINSEQYPGPTPMLDEFSENANLIFYIRVYNFAGNALWRFATWLSDLKSFKVIIPKKYSIGWWLEGTMGPSPRCVSVLYTRI